MSEEAVCDITLKSIKALLKKFPRKKAGFKEYCTENMIIKMEELSESMALEILEIMDSASYIIVLRKKKEEKSRQYHEELIETFENYIKDNTDTFIIIDQVQDCYLLSKQVFLDVKTVNENSQFQPYEKISKNAYFINVIAKLGENFKPTELINKFMSRKCRILSLTHIDAVENILYELS